MLRWAFVGNGNNELFATYLQLKISGTYCAVKPEGIMQNCCKFLTIIDDFAPARMIIDAWLKNIGRSNNKSSIPCVSHEHCGQGMMYPNASGTEQLRSHAQAMSWLSYRGLCSCQKAMGLELLESHFHRRNQAIASQKIICPTDTLQRQHSKCLDQARLQWPMQVSMSHQSNLRTFARPSEALSTLRSKVVMIHGSTTMSLHGELLNHWPTWQWWNNGCYL